MSKSKLSIWRVLATLFLIFVALILGLSACSAIEDYKWYADALESSIASKNGEITPTVEQVLGKEPMSNEFDFDQKCYINQSYSSSGEEWLTAAKALYDSVNIQLYKLILDAPIGEGTPIQSNYDAQTYCDNFIETLPNYENAIIYYEFTGDKVGNKYISLYDKVYYGSNVFKYLTSVDMEMISYILYNDYNIFPEYTTRTSRTWELIGNNIRYGYDRNLYNGSVVTVSDWDLQYYREQKLSSIVAFFILLGLCIVTVAGCATLLYVNFVLHPRKVKADIELQKAHADKLILEADMEKMDDLADELADKYLGKDDR